MFQSSHNQNLNIYTPMLKFGEYGAQDMAIIVKTQLKVKANTQFINFEVTFNIYEFF